MKRILIVSPHFDDAVASCAGKILSEPHNSFTILTIFAAEPPETVSQFAQYLHEKVWHNSSIGATRRNENREACAQLKAYCINAMYLDAIYRSNKHGEWIYPNNGDIFRGIKADDQPIIECVSKYLENMIHNFDEFIFPMGIGNHVDHSIVARIGNKIAHEYPNLTVYFYKDFSYEQDSKPIGKQYERLQYDLDPLIQSKKEISISYYSSQIEMLFQDASRIHQYFEDHYSNNDTFFEVYFRRRKYE